MQADDVVDPGALLNTVALNLVNDHLLADAILAHDNYVLKRNALAVECRLLLLILVAAVILLIALVTQQPAGDCTDRSADQGTFGRLIILVSNDPTDHGTGCSTANHTTSGFRLGANRRAD